MDVETWKSIWFLVFFAASLMFYLVVLIIAAKGMGDMKEVIGKMLQGRRLNS